MKVELKQLEVGYPDRRLIKSVDLELSPGGLHFLIGRNGAGKSTLMRTIAGIQAPLSGQVWINGIAIQEMTTLSRSESIHYLRGRQELRSRISVAEFLQIASGERRILNRQLKAWKDRLSKALSEVGMDDLTDVAVQRLSDGEFQKMMIALVLIRDARVLLLDEPLSHLDPPSQEEMLRLFSSLSAERTVFISSHHMEAVRLHAKRTFVLNASQELMELSDFNSLMSHYY
jgi:ABC-type multidrug transport system ATPase subunit